MGEKRILVPGLTANPAPTAWLERLRDALPSDLALPAVINGGGEEIDRRSDAIMEWINRGGLWLDYCGHPAWWLYNPATGGEDALGQSGWWDRGFHPFSAGRGILDAYFGDMVKLPGAAFKETQFLDVPSGYPFRRGLNFGTISEDIAKRWGFVINEKAPMTSSPLCASNFALRAPMFAYDPLSGRAGYYFYGAWDGSDGVEPEVYAEFVKQVVRYDQPGDGGNSDLPVPGTGSLLDRLKVYAVIGVGVGGYIWWLGRRSRG